MKIKYIYIFYQLNLNSYNNLTFVNYKYKNLEYKNIFL